MNELCSNMGELSGPHKSRSSSHSSSSPVSSHGICADLLAEAGEVGWSSASLVSSSDVRAVRLEELEEAEEAKGDVGDAGDEGHITDPWTGIECMLVGYLEEN